jgi:primosomal protein N' (replication factor Y) (superfamily II helicase)
MFVIEVIPLKRGIHIESLTYFSGERYEPGTILSIPVKNRIEHGVVASVTEASKSKTALRAATFSLRKLPQQSTVYTLSPAFMKTVDALADDYACQKGAIIYQLLPPEVREGKIPLPRSHTMNIMPTEVPEVLQGTTAARDLAYRSLVREAFAHAASTLIVAPSSVEALHLGSALTTGIEDRLIVLSSGLTPKGLKSAYQKLEDFEKPKLIIATPQYSVVERHDITTVIVENSRSGNYIERSRPYLDYRIVLRTHAKYAGRRLIFGDLFPRTEEEVLRRRDIYGTYDEMPKRIMLPGKLSVMQINDKPDGSTPFALFSPKVLSAIEKTRKEKGRTLLYAARRGLSPVVTCMDCGYIFRSPESGAPYSLVRFNKGEAEERWFVCPVSGHKERAADVCPACGSWRLRERGIGIQHVHDELKKKLPDAHVILFDHTTASTLKKAQFLADTFYETKGSLLLATQMVLPHLENEIHTSIVTNMDAVRATPTWRQEEETLALLFRLREVTSGTVYVQTRNEPDELLEFAKTGMLERFYDAEIALREQFAYPPFSRFIHLTWQGPKETVDAIHQDVEALLAPWKPLFYKAPPSASPTMIEYALIRCPEKEWPNQKLTESLRRLHPAVRLMMNPDRIV